MAKLKLKIAKANHVNPSTKKMGYAARVITNGTADYEDIVKEAGHNTTLHKAEVKVSLELCMETVAEMLKQGYIVDFGPVVVYHLPAAILNCKEKDDQVSLDYR